MGASERPGSFGACAGTPDHQRPFAIRPRFRPADQRDLRLRAVSPVLADVTGLSYTRL